MCAREREREGQRERKRERENERERETDLNDLELRGEGLRREARAGGRRQHLRHHVPDVPAIVETSTHSSCCDVVEAHTRQSGPNFGADGRQKISALSPVGLLTVLGGVHVVMKGPPGIKPRASRQKKER